MNKTILLSAIFLLSTGCAATHQWVSETPHWTELGTAYNLMVTKQVANPNVILNPPAGVIEAGDGQVADEVIKTYRDTFGTATEVDTAISVGAGATLN